MLVICSIVVHRFQWELHGSKARQESRRTVSNLYELSTRAYLGDHSDGVVGWVMIILVIFGLMLHMVIRQIILNK